MITKLRVLCLGFKDGFMDGFAFSMGMTYPDYELSELYDQGVNLGQVTLVAIKCWATLGKHNPLEEELYD